MVAGDLVEHGDVACQDWLSVLCRLDQRQPEAFVK